MTDRVEDVGVATAVRREVFVRMAMVVGGVVDPPRDGHDQPPAIAGRSLTSSSLVNGVSRPDR